jgi:hypothetical protein
VSETGAKVAILAFLAVHGTTKLLSLRWPFH